MKSNEKYNAVFEFIKSYISENGYSPSVREICANCGIKSTATAYQYMNKLSEQGLISKAGNKKRAVAIKGATAGKSVSVPARRYGSPQVNLFSLTKIMRVTIPFPLNFSALTICLCSR